MSNLVLPDRVKIQLTGSDSSPVKLEGVLFRIRLRARHKNDFTLQPFGSDSKGLVAITRKELESEVKASYDAGLMDYTNVNDCFPAIEIRLLSQGDIDGAVEARKTWTQLLAGERDRWNSMDELLNVYRSANNGRLLTDRSHAICDNWAKAGAEYSYDFVVVSK